MIGKIYTGTVHAAYYQAPFDKPIHVTFADGSTKRFEGVYFDNALDFFYENKYERASWVFNEKGEMFLTILQ